MESNLVDLSEILKECLWCPTPDNIQNWKFHIDNNKLVVEIDKDQWSHPIDFANHSALISLGGLSFYIQVAAAQSGLAAHYKLKTSPQFRLEVWFETDQINEKYLQYFSCLRKRRTDRRSYKIGAFDASLYEGLMGLSFSERVDLSIVQNPSKNFFNYLEKTEQLMWSDFSIMKATMSLIDFSGVTPKVGFSSQNVGLSKIESRMMAWLGRHPDLLKAFLNYGMAKMGARKTSFPYKHSDGFLLFSASEVSLPAIFEVGRAAIESWLYLTQF
ncbi:MAG: hypothetical protein KDD61_05940, partial [Bdellovibrionales bacterium]|nr:hypothetical protein [Bdellovibrionales bacterium]